MVCRIISEVWNFYGTSRNKLLLDIYVCMEGHSVQDKGRDRFMMPENTREEDNDLF